MEQTHWTPQQPLPHAGRQHDVSMSSSLSVSVSQPS